MPALRIRRLDELEDLCQRGTAEIFDPALMAAIGYLIEDVAQRGDEALLEALERFDGVRCDDPRELAIDAEELERAHSSLEPRLLAGIRAGITNLRAFNEVLAAERSWQREIAPGLVVGEQARPITSAGLFVPSGKGSFPSVLMQIGTPALVAGVPEIVVVVPPKPAAGGSVDDGVLAVAHELSLTSVYRCNGPAGVAALALGTETIPRVRKVVGPGSPPVQAAQILCQSRGCHTQMLLGPSESMIIADMTADPVLVAADLLNEAEHGPDSAAILVTIDGGLIARVEAELERQLAALPEPHAGYATGSVSERGGAFVVSDLDAAAAIANRYAPEHLQLAVADPQALLDLIDHAGEVLLGQDTPFVAANFLLGVPASLPTGGFAHVTGGITAETFLKKTSFAHSAPEVLAALTPGALALAEHEDFPAHAAALRKRSG